MNNTLALYYPPSSELAALAFARERDAQRRVYLVSMAKANAEQPAKQSSAAGGVPKKSHKKKPSSELIAPKPKPKRSEGNSAAAHVESTLAQGLGSQPPEHAFGRPRLRPAWPSRSFGAVRAWFHGRIDNVGADGDDIGDIVRQELLRTPGLEHRSASKKRGIRPPCVGACA